METQVTNQQFFVGGLLFMLIAFLASAAIVHFRKRKKFRFIRSVSLRFDPRELDRGPFTNDTFDEPEDRFILRRSPVLAYESHEGLPQSE